MDKKLLLILFLVGLVFISGCFKIQKDIIKPIDDDVIKINLSDLNKASREACENQNGEWKLFSNGCVDSCGKKPRICTQALTEGCDCGPTLCWDGWGSNECIDDIYEPYATPEEACEATDGTWQKTGTRCPTIKEVEIINGIKVETCPVQEDDVISCICPEGEIFTLQGCNPSSLDLMSIIAYGR